MGLFHSKAGSLQESWEKFLSEEDIVALERQGCDMSEQRAILYAQSLPSNRLFQRKGKTKDVSFSHINLERLDPYKKTPRSMESNFFRDISGNPPIFGKERWLRQLAEAPIVYAAVVQADSSFWEPGSRHYYPAVFVFATDKRHCYDLHWLRETVDRIIEMKNFDRVPIDCQELIENIRDDMSEFCFPLGNSLSDGADAWCATYKFAKQSLLPGKCLPSNGVLPFLLEKPPRYNRLVQFKMIPSIYYME